MFCQECAQDNLRNSFALERTGLNGLGDVGPHDDLSYTGVAAPDKSQVLSDIVLVLSAISLVMSFTKG